MTFVQFELQMIFPSNCTTSYPGTNIAWGHNINHVRGVTISEKVSDFKEKCMTVVTHTDLATTVIQYLMIDGMVRRNTATTQEKILQKLHPYCTICTICTMQNSIRLFSCEEAALEVQMLLCLFDCLCVPKTEFHLSIVNEVYTKPVYCTSIHNHFAAQP